MVGSLIAAAIAVAASESENDRRTTAYTPSFTYTPTVPSSSATTTTSARPTTRASSSVRTTSATPTRPAGPQPVAKLGDHPMFSRNEIGLNNIRCSFPRYSSNPDVARAFFQAGLACLDEMWKPNMGVFNLPFSTPGLVVKANKEELSSPCRSGPASSEAFYCSSSKTIYMAMNGLIDNTTPYPAMEALAILAHEYGHHVQGLTGILGAVHDRRYNLGARTAAGLEMSRRLELEASCFGGMYLGSAQFAGSFSPAEGSAALQDHYRRGDHPGRERDHGSPAHNGSWYEHGYKTNRNFQCNTWLAPSDEVS
ncbi:neutral zinc metallopeptidase [Nocardia amikacinitolerans]|uniref:neutral zinc metallopeptidase n=1 Tax=Nocardia amikacinitolerans TaxID=756689 RepID=UPI0008345C37|nr:neutral zinc metallopeptidase [Nocardia amikacinitolerans]